MATEEMDSLLLYDTPNTEKPQLLRGISSLANENSLPDLSELDPTFESTQNIQQLIERDGLFPDLFGETAGESSQQVQACDTTTADPEASCTSNTLGDLQLNVGNQMHNLKIEVDVDTARALGLQAGGVGAKVQLVKTEDGTFAPVSVIGQQGEAPEVFTVPFSTATTESVELTDDNEQPSEELQPRTKNTLKATPPSRSRRRHVEKGSEDYKEKRARNNIAVRKSRDKAKQRQLSTENRVHELSQENDKLQKKVDLLTKELTVLKGLFINVGASIPTELDQILQ